MIPMYSSGGNANGRMATQNNNTQSVNFKGPSEKVNEKKRILTVKYGANQMKLIRKRIAAEDWLDNELRLLYKCKEDEDYDADVDLETLLDMEFEKEQREYIQEQIQNCGQPNEITEKFIMDVIEKTKTL